MTDPQWNQLVAVVQGKVLERPPVGFIIDCPWLPNWFGAPILDYFTDLDLWFEANRKAIETFPQAMFLPGFWSEFGMCTEPSAFGAKCLFYRNAFPFADKLIRDPAQIEDLAEPDPATDGLLPFMLNRLERARPRIENLGHKIRFSVSRGPLNIASFLMGPSEFLLALKTEPDKALKLLRRITDFLKRWHQLQREAFPSIDGIFLLDDIAGFLGREDFRQFGLPCFKELYAPPAAVKFFHNDAACATSIGFYSEMGVNLYNPGTFNTLTELRRLCGHRLAILGNIPPRDVLANGSPEAVDAAVRKLLAEAADPSRLILSCAGGMPPGVTTGNLRAFLAAARLVPP